MYYESVVQLLIDYINSRLNPDISATLVTVWYGFDRYCQNEIWNYRKESKPKFDTK